jgi:hypothetical protein
MFKNSMRVITIAASLCFAALPALASTVTYIDTGGGGPGNGIDGRPCVFFQVDNQSTYYAIPDASPHAQQSFKVLEDSLLTAGGIPFSFQVGNPVAICGNVQEAVPTFLGTQH